MRAEDIWNMMAKEGMNLKEAEDVANELCEMISQQKIEQVYKISHKLAESTSLQSLTLSAEKSESNSKSIQ